MKTILLIVVICVGLSGCRQTVTQFKFQASIKACKDHGGVFEIEVWAAFGETWVTCKDGVYVKVKR